MSAAERLNVLLVDAGFVELSPALGGKFESYLNLLQRWNSRTNLTAIRDEDGILKRHFVESIGCAQLLPTGIRTLLDFGSGGGFPGIPIALCREEIAVTLAESQGKKAAFLQEAARVLQLNVKVHAARAESLAANFDCVTLRAVDRMEKAVRAASGMIGTKGWMALLTSAGEIEGLRSAAGEKFLWKEPVLLPGTDSRVMILGQQKTLD